MGLFFAWPPESPDPKEIKLSSHFEFLGHKLSKILESCLESRNSWNAHYSGYSFLQLHTSQVTKKTPFENPDRSRNCPQLQETKMAPTGQGNNLWATVSETFFIMVCLLMRPILIPFIISLNSCLVMVPVAGGAAADKLSDLSINLERHQVPGLGLSQGSLRSTVKQVHHVIMVIIPKVKWGAPACPVPVPEGPQVINVENNVEKTRDMWYHMKPYDMMWHCLLFELIPDTYFTKLPPAVTSNG